MTEICINVDNEMKIGEIDHGEIYTESGHTIISVKVIKQIDLPTYWKFVEQHNLLHMVKRNITDKYFYLVEVLD